jgi:hypothetical protein
LTAGFLGGKTITLEDVQRGQKRRVRVPADGSGEFEIEKPADYRFYRYTID